MVSQEYITEAHNVHVIIGNSALFKCEIPSFVTDLVTVVSWSDHEKNEYFLSGSQSLGSVSLSIVLWDTYKTSNISFFSAPYYATFS